MAPLRRLGLSVLVISSCFLSGCPRSGVADANQPQSKPKPKEAAPPARTSIEIEAESLGPFAPPARVTPYEHASGKASVYPKGKPLTWQAKVATAGTYRLWVRARSGWSGDKFTSSKPGIIRAKVDGRAVEMVAIRTTMEYHGDGHNFIWLKSEPLNLDPGSHAIVVKAAWEWAHLDRFVLADEGDFTPPEGNVSRNRRNAGTLTVWTGSPYADPAKNAVPPKQPQRKINLVVPRGGTAYAGFFLHVDKGSPLSVHVRLSLMRLKGKQGEFPAGSVLIGRVARTGMREGSTLASDALAALNDLGYQEILPGAARLYWLLVRPPSDLPAGTYTASILIENQVSLRGVSIPVRVDVSPIVVPATDNLDVFNWWGYFNIAEPWWDDAVAHGVDSFKLIPWHNIRFLFDKDGNLVGDMDFSRLAKHVKYARKTGGYLLLEWDQGPKNLQALQCKVRGAPKGPHLTFLSEPWKRAFKTLVTRTTGYLVSQGIAKDRIIQYIYDEYLGDDFIRVGKLLRKWDPELKIFGDLSTDIDTYRKVAPYVDLWCPERHAIPEMAKDGRLELMRSTGKVWTYAAGYLQRAACPYAKYRLPFWMTYRYKLDGCAYWRHQGDRVGTAYYAMYHDYGAAPVTSRRWEAWYSGMQDYRLLKMLEALAAGDSAHASKASALREKAVRDVVDHPEDTTLAERYRRSILTLLQRAGE